MRLTGGQLAAPQLLPAFEAAVTATTPNKYKHKQIQIKATTTNKYKYKQMQIKVTIHIKSKYKSKSKYTTKINTNKSLQQHPTNALLLI